MNRIATVIVLFFLAMAGPGCATLGGAAVGAGIGSLAGEAGTGAAVGAGVGAVVDIID